MKTQSTNAVTRKTLWGKPGEKVAICDMDYDHLRYTYNMIDSWKYDRKEGLDSLVYGKRLHSWLDAMGRELKRRKNITQNKHNRVF
jgi:hypothetical protein